MRAAIGLMLLVLLTPAPAGAQQPIGPVARPSLIPLARAATLLDWAALSDGGYRGPGVPDTTSPWLYYPLGVGDVWEYYDFVQGLDYVRWVYGEEFLDGRRYAVVGEGSVPAGGGEMPAAVGADARLRFDTTTARVYEYNDGNEILWEPCPFDAPWGTAVTCAPYPYGPPDVHGGYDQLIVFPDGEPPDTLITALKTYDFSPTSWYEIRSYAAGLGLIHFQDEDRWWGLYYARINGVEYGIPRHPVTSEPGPGSVPEMLTLEVRPNPADGNTTAVFTLARRDVVQLEVLDGLGRRVLIHDLGMVSRGRHEVALDFSALPAGRYLVRLSAPFGAVARPMIMLR